MHPSYHPQPKRRLIPPSQLVTSRPPCAPPQPQHTHFSPPTPTPPPSPSPYPFHLRSSRHMVINGGSDVTITGLHFINGERGGHGACMYIAYSTVTITNTNLTNCEITANKYGAGIFATSSSTLIVTGSHFNECIISGNNGYGAGLFMNSGTVAELTDTYFTNCAITGNTGRGAGMAIGVRLLALCRTRCANFCRILLT